MTLRVRRATLRHGDGRRLHLYGDHGPVVDLGGDAPGEPAGEPAGPPTGDAVCEPAGEPAGPPTGDAVCEPAGLHLRHDALTDSWIGVSPRRNSRPQATPATPVEVSCPLCPQGPEVPFDYTAAVFDNRFPSLVGEPPSAPPLGQATAPSRGRCEVVLYTSAHEGCLADLPPDRLAGVIAMWADRSDELWAQPDIAHVMVFENRGEAVGATLSHPHGQIYAFDRLPPFVRERAVVLERHREARAECLTCRLVADDLAATERQVFTTDAFVVTVPFAARWPYEVHVRARRHGLGRLGDLDAAERRDLAHALRTVVTAYDAVYDRPLPYMMTVMEAPRTGPGPATDHHLAVEFLPPNRAPDRLKVRASVETATGFFINDTVPEDMTSLLVDALARAGGEPTSVIPDVEIVHDPPAATATPTPGGSRHHEEKHP